MKRFQKYLDTEDAARLAHCHPETIRLLVRTGKLKPVDDRPPYVFTIEAIKALPSVKIGRPKKSHPERR